MRRQTLRFSVATGIVTAALFGYGTASAAAFNFNETFNAPPLTPGTDSEPNSAFWEDGFKNGDNGWVLIEQGSPGPNQGVGGTGFGQRPMSFWPHNDDSAVSQVRVRSGYAEAFAIRDLTSTPLVKGNVTMTLMGYAPLGDISYSLRLADATGAISALQLDFGTTQGGSQKFHVNQIGGGNVVVADDATTTTGGAPLLWNTAFSTTAGDYAVLSVDFDLLTQMGSVVITTVDASGMFRSTAPVSVSLDGSLSDISRISLNANDVSTVNGSLSYVGNFSISGDLVPEPSMLSLIGFLGVALRRRRSIG